MGMFLNSYEILHSIVAFVCFYILKCCDLTANCFLILFSSGKLFLVSKTEIEHKPWELKVKYSWINMLPAHLYFLKLRLYLSSQEKTMMCEKLFAKNVYGMA